MTALEAAAEFLEHDGKRDLLGLHSVRVQGRMCNRSDVALMLRHALESDLITGISKLSDEQARKVGSVRAVETAVGELIAALMADEAVDQRAASIARTELQSGFMWLVRAVAKPTTF